MPLNITLYLGSGGTGKSYLLKQMSQRTESHIFAPTWSVANKIQGTTIYNYCKSSFIKLVPKKFTRQHVFIDEIFMFSKKEMQGILACSNEDTHFYFFGDPFQLKSPSKDGPFYEAIVPGTDKTLPKTLYQVVKVVYLTKYYRSQEDVRLQNVLQLYRQKKRIQINERGQDQLNVQTTRQPDNGQDQTNQATHQPDQPDQLNPQPDQLNPQPDQLNNQATHQPDQHNQLDARLDAQVIQGPDQTNQLDAQLNTQPSLSPTFNIIHSGHNQKYDLAKLIQQGAIILVGTHKAEEYFQKIITKLFKKQCLAGIDGNLYRPGQIIFSISSSGPIEERLVFLRFDSDKNMIVKKYADQKEYTIYPKRSDKSYYQIKQGNVITINIAQGLEFEKVIIDSSSMFEFGSMFTAISRVRSFDDIYIYERDGYDKVFEIDMQNVYCQ